MLKVKVQGYELSILCIDLVVDLIRKQTYNCIDISTNNIVFTREPLENE